jgi:hypothetical protein
MNKQLTFRLDSKEDTGQWLSLYINTYTSKGNYKWISLEETLEKIILHLELQVMSPLIMGGFCPKTKQFQIPLKQS